VNTVALPTGPVGAALRHLFAQLQEELDLCGPLRVYLAGGMAMYLYVGKRATDDVDAEFAARVLVPDLISPVGEEGWGELYFDTNYNSSFALLHENYQDDALTVDLGLTWIDLRVLTPLDLAISKIARYAPVDREDIADLIRAGLTSASEIEARARDALAGYIGRKEDVLHKLDHALDMARRIESA